MDIIASSIISTYYVNKTHNSILKVPWFHAPGSHFSKYIYDTMGNISEQKLAKVDSFRTFDGILSVHTSPEILTKHNIKETVSKVNIWGSFYTPKDEGSNGG